MSNTCKTEYFKAKGENNFLKVELFYSLGGINYWNYKNEPRGYFVSVCPVTREKHEYGGRSYYSEGFTIGSGRKMLVEPCARKGKGAEARALEKYEAAKNELLELYRDQFEAENVA